MAFEIISTNQVATYDIHDTDEVVLLKDTNIVVTSGHAVQGIHGGDNIFDGVEFYVHGDIIAQDDGINFFDSGINTTNNTHIVLSAGASVTAGGDGILLQEGENNRIINYGQIIADEAAIYVLGGEIDFQNYGSIIGSDGSNQSAVIFQFQPAGTDIRHFANFGTISGVSGNTYGVVDNTDGAEFIGSNSGSITSGGGKALESNADFNSFFNSGLIEGSVTFQNATTFINTGIVDGHVSLGSDADFFDGRGGDVYGTVAGGTGDDIYVVDDADDFLVEAAAAGTDTVEAAVSFKLGDNFENLTLIGTDNTRGIGNGEVNTITGNMGDNRLRGKAGSDSISGGEGDDKIWGGVGLEVIHGDDGEDVIRGGLSNDILHGDDDDDVLYGNRQNDTLYGGGADDRLIGGLGRDTLYGGQGEDEFVFNRKNDSVDSVDADQIRDFVVGEDVIDLSGLAGALTYIGGAAFSGAVGEVQMIPSGGTVTRVKLDLDGDSIADMKIMVIGTVGLSEADFIL